MSGIYPFKSFPSRFVPSPSCKRNAVRGHIDPFQDALRDASFRDTYGQTGKFVCPIGDIHGFYPLQASQPRFCTFKVHRLFKHHLQIGVAAVSFPDLHRKPFSHLPSAPPPAAQRLVDLLVQNIIGPVLRNGRRNRRNFLPPATHNRCLHRLQQRPNPAGPA